MEMIRVGEALGADALPYDGTHRRVWTALAAGDRPAMVAALADLARRSPAPLVQAVAGVALTELGEGASAAEIVAQCAAATQPGRDADAMKAVASALRDGKDPFSVLPDIASLNGRPIALRGMVSAIVGSSDPRKAMRDFERLFARHRPADGSAPAPGYASASTILNLFYPPRYLNVGGGERFIHPFWVNVDLVAPAGAGPRLRFSPQTVLPLEDRSIELAYSSHCLEHLDDATVMQLLREMRRVLGASGRLVLKLPDGEEALRQWRAGNKDWFDAPHWGLDSVAWTWAGHGVQDGLDSRFAMVFCGYWNEAMTRPGTARELLERGAFHGPPRVDPALLRRLAAPGSPHALAQGLRAVALQEDPAARFNHQNAWGQAELRELLEAAGFDLRSMDAGEVVSGNADIPGIGGYRGISISAAAGPAGLREGVWARRGGGRGGATRLPVRNAAAWVPAELPDVSARAWRRGMIKLHKVLWEYHADMVKRLRGAGAASHFLSYGFTRGSVPEQLRVEMEGIFDGEPCLFEYEDCRADGLMSGLHPSEIEDLRQNLRYFMPDRMQQSAIRTFLAAIRQQVEAELQTPWRVLNVRCYDTSLSFRSGPQLWHRDGFPSAIQKLLVYLSGSGEPVKGSELLDLQGQHVAVTGQSGTWLMFDPNRLLHRGPGSNAEDRRRIVEITFCGDFVSDTDYRFGGTNYRHPICPPSIDPFQQENVVQMLPLLNAVVRTAQELTELEDSATDRR